ncbi:hypothetical protein S245_018430, partial [Arachis hypogaea]
NQAAPCEIAVEDRRVAEIVASAAWLRFSATGNPNLEHRPLAVRFAACVIDSDWWWLDCMRPLSGSASLSLALAASSSGMASTQANASENPTNIPVSQSGSTAGIASKRKVSKNALGSRTDVGWEHGISVGEDGKKIQCKYCHKIFSGGVYRLKHHLAGTQKDVGACTAVSDEIKKQMWDVVSGLQVNLMKKTSVGGASPGEATKEVDTTGEKRKGKELDGNIFKKTRISTQTTINNIFKKNLREEVCLEISAFFYNNGIPFNVSRSEEYSR